MGRLELDWSFVETSGDVQRPVFSISKTPHSISLIFGTCWVNRAAQNQGLAATQANNLDVESTTGFGLSHPTTMNPSLEQCQAQKQPSKVVYHDSRLIHPMKSPSGVATQSDGSEWSPFGWGETPSSDPRARRSLAPPASSWKQDLCLCQHYLDAPESTKEMSRSDHNTGS
jgi:hypothetical protein